MVQKDLPVWRELKLIRVTVNEFMPLLFRKTFPFEGNWNFSLLICSLCLDQFRKTFPFEGNWNSFLVGNPQFLTNEFRKTFPFEGNWNEILYLYLVLWSLCSERPSRLKGIETCYATLILIPKCHCVQKDLPVWRELKRNGRKCGWMSWGRFRKTFPFEGNWNPTKMSSTPSAWKNVQKDLPVWRELKQWSCVVHCNLLKPPVQKDLPVWRELKLRCHPFYTIAMLVGFGKTFPFEGNWNLKNKVLKILSESVFGKTFPFEGNWNNFSARSAGVPSRFGKTFPFEGNWNPKESSTTVWVKKLGKTFPFEGNWNTSFM